MIRNGRNQDRAYGNLDPDARHIMDHVEGLIETLETETQYVPPNVDRRQFLKTQIGILEQIAEVAFERNIYK